MGLDITAYSHMKTAGEYRTHGDEDGEGCEEELEHTVTFAYDGFERSMRGLTGVEKQGIVGSNFIGGDCYAPTEQTESMGFRAGSYSGYNAWRDELAKIAGFSNAGDYWNGSAGEDAPFYELINFADNEGTIGPEAAKDLLKDFRDHQGKAIAFWRDSGVPEAHWKYDIERYQDWTKACELAAADGLISFH